MYYHANIENQLKEIFKNASILKYKPSNNENELTDFIDGKIYRKLLESEDGELFKKNEAFSFIINTDGISVCSKSKLTIWPFYLAINEIPIEDRFLIENMVLAGKKS
jgi:hypothetical protein